jgi:hypothetical protein
MYATTIETNDRLGRIDDETSNDVIDLHKNISPKSPSDDISDLSYIHQLNRSISSCCYTFSHLKYDMPAQGQKKRVLVVGAGAAGMACADGLAKHPDKFEVTLIGEWQTATTVCVSCQCSS